VKAIDVWMSVCLVFAFGSLIEFAIVNVWSRKEAGRPVMEAGRSPMEAGRSPMEAGRPPVEAGRPPSICKGVANQDKGTGQLNIEIGSSKSVGQGPPGKDAAYRSERRDTTFLTTDCRLGSSSRLSIDVESADSLQKVLKIAVLYIVCLKLFLNQ